MTSHRYSSRIPTAFVLMDKGIRGKLSALHSEDTNEVAIRIEDEDGGSELWLEEADMDALAVMVVELRRRVLMQRGVLEHRKRSSAAAAAATAIASGNEGDVK